MRAHYCWHSASFSPPAHKYEGENAQACDKHAHQMHKNKKVWVWSATNRKYGFWYITKKKRRHTYAGSRRNLLTSRLSKIYSRGWNIGCSYFGTIGLIPNSDSCSLFLCCTNIPTQYKLCIFLFFLSFLEQSRTNALLHPWFIIAFLTCGQIKKKKKERKRRPQTRIR